MYKSVLLYLFYAFHLFILFMIVIAPFVINHPIVLLSIIILNSFTITGWYIVGHCFFTDIENWLNPQDVTENPDESFIMSFLANWLFFIKKETVFTIASTVPFLTIIVCCYKLYYYNIMKMSPIEDYPLVINDE